MTDSPESGNEESEGGEADGPRHIRDHRALLHRVGERAAGLLAGHGLALEVDGDLRRWAAHLRAAPDADGVNPSFDPAHSPIGAGDGFWVKLSDGAGRAVGCCAYRAIRTAAFIDLVHSGRLWADPVPDAQRWPTGCSPSEGLPRLKGVVGHIGGLWVHPKYRGRGMVKLLIQPARAVALNRFPLTWETAVAFVGVVGRPQLWGSYQFERTVLCHDGYFPPTGTDERIFLGYSTRRHTEDHLVGGPVGGGHGGPA